MADHFTSDQFGRGRRIRVAGARAPRQSSPVGRKAALYGAVSFIPLVSLLAAWNGLRCLDPRNEIGIASRLLGVFVILLGLVFTAVHVLMGFRGVEYYHAVQTGAAPAFAAAYEDGPDAFGAGFAGEITPPKPFIRVMEGRYGAFQSSERVREEHDWMTWFEAPSTPRRYQINFERGEMEAEVSIDVKLLPGSDWLKSRIARFEIIDERRGNIMFPGTAAETRVVADENTGADEEAAADEDVPVDENVAADEEITVDGTEVATTGS